MNNIAILGLGTVGFGVYDIIKKTLPNTHVKYILDKNKACQKLVDDTTLVVTDFEIILNDKDVSIIVETMGAGDFSYQCILKAIDAKKSVATANKEVIASHLEELSNKAKANNVALRYEASVGGGIPIIDPLYKIRAVNQIDEIYGILNGTTNFILSNMTNENMDFNQALKLAQEKGFAEADPTADLEGLDMVRKIAILSSIAYQTSIDIDTIYHYGISTISSLDIKYFTDNGYVVKLLAYSTLNKDASIIIEPVLVKASNLLANVSNECNLVSVNASINGNLKFYGKGAGRYPTANAIVNDIIAITDNSSYYSFEKKTDIKISELNKKHRYYCRLLDNVRLDSEIIEDGQDNFIITKPIGRVDILNLVEKCAFYARVIEEEE